MGGRLDRSVVAISFFRSTRWRSGARMRGGFGQVVATIRRPPTWRTPSSSSRCLDHRVFGAVLVLIGGALLLARRRHRPT